MLVSAGNKSYWRTTHKVTLKRNGTFIDIHYEQDGCRKWIGIDENDLRRLLAIGGHGASVEGYVQFDEPVDFSTALLDFMATRSAREAVQPGNQQG